jgi:hypothetical protein
VGDVGVATLVHGERRPQEGQTDRDRGQGDAREQEAKPLLTRRRLAVLVGAYALGLGTMIAVKGLYLSADRYFLILLVPALALGVWRRYLLDFAPFVACIIAYEELRGVAHVLSPHPFYRPQLDIDRWLFFGHVPTIWLQQHLWDGHVSWWELCLVVLTKLHFIVPPTLLFVAWLFRRDLFYRFAATLVAVSLIGAIGFWLFPAAPPWMAAQHHLIPSFTRIDYLGAARPGANTTSWLYHHILPNEAAAVPSLHAAYSFLVVLFCFRIDRRLGLVALPYALLMWFAIVYFGEHYVSDALIGIAVAAVTEAVVSRLIARTRLRGPFPAPLASSPI